MQPGCYPVEKLVFRQFHAERMAYMELEAIYGAGFQPDGRDRDISVLCLYDTLTGKSEEIARFSQLVEAPQDRKSVV